MLERNLIVTLVPKTGGTALRCHFQKYYPDITHVVEYRKGKLCTDVPLSETFVLITLHFGVSRLVEDGVLTREQFDSALKVVTTRNIYSRALSVWQGTQWFRGFAFEEFLRRVQLGCYRCDPLTHTEGKMASKNIKNYVPLHDQEKDMHELFSIYDFDTSKFVHTLPQSVWLSEPHDAVIRVEHIDADLEGIAGKQPKPIMPANVRPNKATMSEQYTANTRELVAMIYADDVTILPEEQTFCGYRLLKILFLCRKHWYDTKMARMRFFNVEAIGRRATVDWWGQGWPGYRAHLPVGDNLKQRKRGPYDVVYVYKPREHTGVAQLPMLKVIEYDEMTDTDNVIDELTTCSINLAVCHYRNEMEVCVPLVPTCNFMHIPHCYNPFVFNNRHPIKTTDVVLVGRLDPEVYPLRTRVCIEVLPILQKWGYRVRVWRHPGYDLGSAWKLREIKEYADAVSDAHIAVTCSATPRIRCAKFVEVPMCGTALATDLPDEDQEFFRDITITLDNDMSSEEIAKKLATWIRDRKKIQALTEKAFKKTKPFSTDFYSVSVINVMKKLLAQQV
jgi:hypothetical protein